jgi:hypothetical protein
LSTVSRPQMNSNTTTGAALTALSHFSPSSSRDQICLLLYWNIRPIIAAIPRLSFFLQKFAKGFCTGFIQDSTQLCVTPYPLSKILTVLFAQCANQSVTTLVPNLAVLVTAAVV